VNAFLQFEHISKTFPGVQALGDVSFSVSEGNVHALVGENGAGKSTLLKILSGASAPSAGCVRVAGTERRFASSAEAIRAGVAVIHQELQLAPDLSVAENIYLGNLPARIGILNRKQLRADAQRQLQRLGEDIDPFTPIRQLSMAQRQMVEIAKALARGAKILAFDEPTSSLSSREVQRLFAIIRELQRANHVILYVSHRLDEIFSLCDSATVLRDGRHVQTFTDLKTVSSDMLVNSMVGRNIADVFQYQARAHGAMALELVGVSSRSLPKPASFGVKQGEIVGLFGLVGAGRSELMRLLYGAERMRTGTVHICGEPVVIRSPADAIRKGLMFCPEDRKQHGIVAVRSVLENINMSARRIHSHAGVLINERWERANANRQIRQLGIRTPSPRQLMRNLSGGNQQKAILARWLSEKIKVILLDEPTRGIDVGAKSEVYSIIFDLARQGVGVVIASSDLPEALGICDRLLIMRHGEIVGELAREQASEAAALRLALPAGESVGARQCAEGEVNGLR